MLLYIEIFSYTLHYDLVQRDSPTSTMPPECFDLTAKLQSEMNLLEYKNSNLTRTVEHWQAIHKADVQNLQRLRWLHRKNGEYFGLSSLL